MDGIVFGGHGTALTRFESELIKNTPLFSIIALL